MIIFGGAKSWKSILALHTQYCISTGTPWFGFKTTPSTTFRFQVELPKKIDRDRVSKYMNGSRPDNMLFKTAPYAKIDTTYGRQQLEKDIKEVQNRCPDTHVVLILDPIYLLITGHISDDYDIKRLLDNINDVKAKLGISVIAIHHSHKTRVDNAGNVVDLGSEEIMGSSYFNNWADTMVRVKLLNPMGKANRVELTFGLVRHAENTLPKIELEWQRHNLKPIVLNVTEPTDEEPSIRNLI